MTAPSQEAGRSKDYRAAVLAAHAFTLIWLRQRWNRLRLRVGAFVLGRGWFNVVTTLQLVHLRALDCITEDGQVILAKCQPLADVLYAKTPSFWRLTIELLDAPASPAHTTEEGTP